MFIVLYLNMKHTWQVKNINSKIYNVKYFMFPSILRNSLVEFCIFASELFTYRVEKYSALLDFRFSDERPEIIPISYLYVSMWVVIYFSFSTKWCAWGCVCVCVVTLYFWNLDYYVSCKISIWLHRFWDLSASFAQKFNPFSRFRKLCAMISQNNLSKYFDFISVLSSTHRL